MLLLCCQYLLHSLVSPCYVCHVPKSLHNLDRLERLHLMHDNNKYRAVWIGTVAAELLAVAHAITTGDFNPFVFYTLLIPMGFCCAFQACNNDAVQWIRKARNGIAQESYLDTNIQEAIAAVQPPTPISQPTQSSIHLFGRVTPTPAPSIDKISANTPLHFAS